MSEISIGEPVGTRGVVGWTVTARIVGAFDTDLTGYGVRDGIGLPVGGLVGKFKNGSLG